MKQVRFLVALALLGCSSDDSTSTKTTPSDAAAEATLDAGSDATEAFDSSDASTPTSCLLDEETSTNADGVVLTRAHYASAGGVDVYAELCRPSGNGPFPTLVWNHGGWLGITGYDQSLCKDIAKTLGWAVVMSEYRGEGSSSGDVEICLGEVDDVLALLSCTQTLPWSDPARVLMAGASHGGCITLRAIQRGAPVAAAGAVFPPTDWTAEHAFWTQALQDPSNPGASLQAQVLAVLEKAAGTPTEAPAAYVERSPIAFLPELASFAGDLLVVQGTDDILVPVTQACALANAAGNFEARHYDATGANLVATAPPGCNEPLTWLTTPAATDAARELRVFDGATHSLDTSTAAQKAMLDSMGAFLVAKMP